MTFIYWSLNPVFTVSDQVDFLCQVPGWHSFRAGHWNTKIHVKQAKSAKKKYNLHEHKGLLANLGEVEDQVVDAILSMIILIPFAAWVLRCQETWSQASWLSTMPGTVMLAPTPAHFLFLVMWTFPGQGLMCISSMVRLMKSTWIQFVICKTSVLSYFCSAQICCTMKCSSMFCGSPPSFLLHHYWPQPQWIDGLYCLRLNEYNCCRW